MKTPFGYNFDRMEFFEFLWLYERLVKEKQKENEANSTSTKTNTNDLASEMMKREGLS